MRPPYPVSTVDVDISKTKGESGIDANALEMRLSLYRAKGNITKSRTFGEENEESIQPF